MTKLHFVGFNGYQQCPKTDIKLSKIVENWVSIEDEDVLDVCCSHRFVLIENKEVFKINGVVKDDNPNFIAKPGKIEKFSSCEEFLIASHETYIWKFEYKKWKWEKVNVSFVSQEEENVWNEKENEIIKLTFLLNDVLLLLNNGSVWKLTESQLKLIFSYDVEKAVDISSGFEHGLILTESGCVLSFGNGSREQLGNGDLNPSKEPLQISALEGLEITKIHAGGWHSCAVTDSGDLCTWGWNNYGQLAAFEDSKEMGLSALPVFVDVGSDSELGVVDVACGSRHTIARLENGDLYSTGWNAYRQLGTESVSDKTSTFTKCNIKTGSNVKLCCGPWYTILLEFGE